MIRIYHLPSLILFSFFFFSSSPSSFSLPFTLPFTSSISFTSHSHTNPLTPLVRKSHQELLSSSSSSLLERFKKRLPAYQNIIDKVDPNEYSKRKKKVLILMCDTGGGHRASAEAINQGLRYIQKPSLSSYLTSIFTGNTKVEVSVEVLDIWVKYSHFPFTKFPQCYKFMANHPLTWKLFFKFTSTDFMQVAGRILTYPSCVGRIRSELEKRDPDMIISVHPLCQVPILASINYLNKKRMALNKPFIPFITIVTDLGSAHRTWFCKDMVASYIPSNSLRSIARKEGVKDDKLLLSGIPLRSSFWQGPSSKKAKENVKERLKLKNDHKTVFVMGGGDGVGGLEKISQSIHSHLPPKTNMIVLCGKDKKVRKKLKEHFKLNNLVKILPFSNNINELMSISSLVVTKAGPGSIYEAAVCGTPVVISSFLPGQEEGNVPLTVKAGYSIYPSKSKNDNKPPYEIPVASAPSPQQLGEAVGKLLRDDNKLKIMKKNALNFGHPKTTLEISKDILDCLNNPVY